MSVSSCAAVRYPSGSPGFHPGAAAIGPARRGNPHPSRGEHALHPVQELDRGVDVDRLAGVGTLGTLGTLVADAEVDEVRGVLLRHLDRRGDEGFHLGGVLTADGAVGVGAEFADANDSSTKSPAARSAVPNMSRYLWTPPVAL